MARRASLSSMMRTLASVADITLVLLHIDNVKSYASSVYFFGPYDGAVGRRTVLKLGALVQRVHACGDGGDEQVDVERLADGTGDEGRIEVAGLVAGGEDDDHRPIVEREFLQLIEDFPSVPDRHHQVEQHDGVGALAQPRQSLGSVARAVDCEPPAGQDGEEQSADCVVVVDDENPFVIPRHLSLYQQVRCLKKWISRLWIRDRESHEPTHFRSL